MDHILPWAGCQNATKTGRLAYLKFQKHRTIAASSIRTVHANKKEPAAIFRKGPDIREHAQNGGRNLCSFFMFFPVSSPCRVDICGVRHPRGVVRSPAIASETFNESWSVAMDFACGLCSPLRRNRAHVVMEVGEGTLGPQTIYERP